MNKKEAEADAVRQTKEGRVASGRSNGMSGRDLFTFNPNLIDEESDDEDDGQADWDLVGYRAETEKAKNDSEAERIKRLEGDFSEYSIAET